MYYTTISERWMKTYVTFVRLDNGYKTVLCGWSGRTVLCNGWQDEECDEIGNVEKSDNIF